MTEEQAGYDVGKKKANTKNEPTEDLTCFVVTPIGNDGSTTRRHIDGIYDVVILPVMDQLGVELNRKIETTVAHKITEPGNINNQVIRRLIESDLVIANLTGLNPNVMYEIAVRHAYGKPIVTLFEVGTSIPFDLHGERSIEYTNDIAGVTILKSKLLNFSRSALNAKNDPLLNPITSVHSAITFEDSEAPPEERAIIRMLLEIQDSINAIKPPDNRKRNRWWDERLRDPNAIAKGELGDLSTTQIERTRQMALSYSKDLVLKGNEDGSWFVEGPANLVLSVLKFVNDLRNSDG